ncbi:MAG: hypothetical protein Udaeo2_12620 [Candidatus Udaeobacter sp.]|nr:MAG: hypothetical protein Udaeo2_12620 [Candidatus Udaeobacter sp.]
MGASTKHAPANPLASMIVEHEGEPLFAQSEVALYRARPGTVPGSNSNQLARRARSGSKAAEEYSCCLQLGSSVLTNKSVVSPGRQLSYALLTPASVGAARVSAAIDEALATKSCGDRCIPSTRQRDASGRRALRERGICLP